MGLWLSIVAVGISIHTSGKIYDSSGGDRQGEVGSFHRTSCTACADRFRPFFCPTSNAMNLGVGSVRTCRSKKNHSRVKSETSFVSYNTVRTNQLLSIEKREAYQKYLRSD